MFGRGPNPIGESMNEGLRGVRFGEIGIECDRPVRRGLGFGQCLQRGHDSVYAQHVVAVRQSGVGQRVFGVLVDRLLKIIKRLS